MDEPSDELLRLLPRHGDRRIDHIEARLVEKACFSVILQVFRSFVVPAMVPSAVGILCRLLEPLRNGRGPVYDILATVWVPFAALKEWVAS